MNDTIANLVIQCFNELPKKGKPIVRGNGDVEWTVLAGIVVENVDDGQLECVSLATGMKATPNDHLQKARGMVLHDMHAEILATRGFNRFLISQYNTSNSRYFDGNNAFTHKVYLYVSEAPCGDASLGLMNEGVEYIWMDALVRVRPDDNSPVTGRDHFHQTGLTRTKPGRRTALRTFSKSCSDKLALRQNTSLLLGPVAKIIQPIYLSTLIVPENRFVIDDYTRAFRHRITSEHYFEFGTTTIKFDHERKDNSVSCPHSLVWIKGIGSEAILNGVKMGFKPFQSAKGASMVCRAAIWNEIMVHSDTPTEKSYLEWKYCENRQKVKHDAYQELGNWVCTASDDFSFDPALLLAKEAKRRSSSSGQVPHS